MDIEKAQDLIGAEMTAVNELIIERLQSDVALINQLGHYIINSGGKRLRPQLAVLAARAAGYEGSDHLQIAAIIEFIHTATLLHDDVVDASELRRGRDTANAVFGNEAAVLVGDFLYSRSFEMMVELDSMRIMSILARATNVIAEGEVMQLLNIHDADTSEDRYLEVIHSKTAKLFEAATRIGAVLNGLDEEREQAMADYGMHLGTAFQLIDDVLDYSAETDETGKNIGDDLAEGKPTLPLIHAMREGTAEQAALVRQAIETGGLDALDGVVAAIESTGALEFTRRAAQREADAAVEAIGVLPPSKYRDALVALAQFSVDRAA
ncbi:MAG: octaprenyl diphosphate synthase [Pseudomonadota bacterium]